MIVLFVMGAYIMCFLTSMIFHIQAAATISYFENESRGLVRSSIDFLSKSFHHNHQLLRLQQHQQRPSSPTSRNCQHCHNPTTTSVVVNDKTTVIALISMGETATATYLAEWCIQSMRVDPFNSQLCNT
jgi:tetrahydrodipicolinate N-succinyltransferase